jgi:hypothetical protein
MSESPDACRRTSRWALSPALTAVTALFLCLPLATPQAGDTNSRRPIGPEIKTWIEALTDQHGIGCCAIADGTRPREITWDITASSYRVKVGTQWLSVPDEAVIKGPNRLGYAVAWIDYDWDINTGGMTLSVRCFLPGAAS